MGSTVTARSCPLTPLRDARRAGPGSVWSAGGPGCGRAPLTGEGHQLASRGLPAAVLPVPTAAPWLPSPRTGPGGASQPPRSWAWPASGAAHLAALSEAARPLGADPPAPSGLRIRAAPASVSTRTCEKPRARAAKLTPLSSSAREPVTVQVCVLSTSAGAVFLR